MPNISATSSCFLQASFLLQTLFHIMCCDDSSCCWYLYAECPCTTIWLYYLDQKWHGQGQKSHPVWVRPGCQSMHKCKMQSFTVHAQMQYAVCYSPCTNAICSLLLCSRILLQHMHPKCSLSTEMKQLRALKAVHAMDAMWHFCSCMTLETKQGK